MKILDDIYFNFDYAKINEKIELGIAERFCVDCDFGSVEHLFIKRMIPGISTPDGMPYYDIRTPYGYGGPRLVEVREKEKLISEFESRFGEYCKHNNIISEFVRFHPVVENALDFQAIYPIEFNRKTVGTNISAFDDPVNEEFTKKCRKNIRRALKELDYEVIEYPDDLDDFQKIYYQTMDRNHAQDYYYFDDSYFEQLLKYFKNHMIEVKVLHDYKTVAAGIYFVWGKIMQIHLSGTLSDYLKMNPPYVLRYAIIQWAMEHEIDVVHHGGGRTSNEEDGLYQFKKQFGQQTSFDFYIAEKVWNPVVYESVNSIKKTDETMNDYIRRNI